MSAYATYSDEALLGLIQADDQHAFTALYERHWERLYRLAAYKLGGVSGAHGAVGDSAGPGGATVGSRLAGSVEGAAMAEDIIQDVFIDLWKRRGEILVTGAPGAYLSSAVKYKVLDARLRMARQQQREKDYQALHAGTPGAESSGTRSHSEIERLADFRLLQEHVRRLLGQLPEKTQQIFTMSREQGFSHRQIASELEVSEKTVEYHLGKVVKMMRAGLGQFFSFTVFFSSLFISI